MMTSLLFHSVRALLFSYFGITTINSAEITGFVNAVIAIIGFVTALWSWYMHRSNNANS